MHQLDNLHLFEYRAVHKSEFFWIFQDLNTIFYDFWKKQICINFKLFWDCIRTLFSREGFIVKIAVKIAKQIARVNGNKEAYNGAHQRDHHGFYKELPTYILLHFASTNHDNSLALMTHGNFQHVFVSQVKELFQEATLHCVRSVHIYLKTRNNNPGNL